MFSPKSKPVQAAPRIEHTLILGILVVLALAGCGSDDPLPTAPAGPETAIEFTTRGWQRFEAENFSGALSDFDRAVVLEPESGEALAGRGWCLIVEASSPAMMLEAANVFSSAIAAGEDTVYVVAGRAVALLGAGSNHLAEAISEAQRALDSGVEFVFSHRPSFNTSDLRLVEAIALVTIGDFTHALSAANPIQPSGIDRTDPMTWEVEEISHDTFPGVVMAFLDSLSRQYSG